MMTNEERTMEFNRQITSAIFDVVSQEGSAAVPCDSIMISHVSSDGILCMNESTGDEFFIKINGISDYEGMSNCIIVDFRLLRRAENRPEVIYDSTLIYSNEQQEVLAFGGEEKKTADTRESNGVSALKKLRGLLALCPDSERAEYEKAFDTVYNCLKNGVE